MIIIFTDFEITFCTYFKRIDCFSYESEVYDEYVAFCLKNGRFLYKTGNSEEKILSSGEVAICPPGKVFFRKVIESIEMCMIKFKLHDETKNISDFIKVNDVLRYNQNLEKLENCMFCSEMEKEPFFAHFCKDIIYMLSDDINKTDVFHTEKKYIEENYSKNISISELARKNGYSVVHFINKFKSQYGCTPGQYLCRIRLQKAKELLMVTDMTSKEISYICGFNDELYFIRFFKKHSGVTPKEFRKSMICL